ncbi:MAG: HIT domain-containing protein [Alphaproteobacteria bacterium]|nr:HIT domain-containing protein [Alphaproteobacteria bacterium]MBN2780284.1 HIT domain-containing protein [Alphaproteobacteria bacterium]
MYNKDNLFAKILRKEIPADIVFENDRILAFKDIVPKMATHILIIPKNHIISFVDLINGQNNETVGQFFRDIKSVGDHLGLKGYKLEFHVQPEGGQEIPHLHAHLLSDKKLDEEK